MPRKRKKLLFLVTEDWYFYSHRISLACAAKEAGYDVVVVTNIHEHGTKIREYGLTLINLDFKRRKKNPFSAIATIKQIINIYSREKPYIVHHVSLKPVILGSIASYICKVPYIINTLTGLGSVFVSESFLDKLIKILIFEPILGLLFKRKNSYTIVQNIDDKKRLLALGVVRNERTYLIRGSGVNIDLFTHEPERDEEPIVLFAARMIKDKGVEEFIKAARQLYKENINARFVLAGDIDPDNPSSMNKKELMKWHEAGIIEWWGYKDDMQNIFKKVHIICLPSLYGEGLPKVLLEGAASGRSLIASDIPGCREIVRNGENGFLVPAKNTDALVDAIKKLIENKSLRENMGKKGRELVETDFSSEKINNETIDLYKYIEELEN